MEGVPLGRSHRHNLTSLLCEVSGVPPARVTPQEGMGIGTQTHIPGGCVEEGAHEGPESTVALSTIHVLPWTDPILHTGCGSHWGPTRESHTWHL